MPIKILSAYAPNSSETLNYIYSVVQNYFAFKHSSNLPESDMVIEVPKEQYATIIAQLKREIELGHFKNDKGEIIDDVLMVSELIKQGAISYNQALNLAKSNNIKALSVNVGNNIINCSYDMGISVISAIALAFWQKESLAKAFKHSLKSSSKNSLSSLAQNISAQQIASCIFKDMGLNTSEKVVNSIYHSKIGHSAIENLATYASGHALKGGASVSYVANLLRSNIISSVITATLLTSPDIYKAIFKKNITWAQVSKNLLINTSCVLAGASAWMVGASLGAMAGSVVPIVGNTLGGVVGGTIFAIAGSSACGIGVKKIVDKIRVDDSQILLALCEEAIKLLCYDFLLSESEAQLLIERLAQRIDQNFIDSMCAYYIKLKGSKEETIAFIYYAFLSEVEAIVTRRKSLDLDFWQHNLLLG